MSENRRGFGAGLAIGLCVAAAVGGAGLWMMASLSFFVAFGIAFGVALTPVVLWHMFTSSISDFFS